MLIIKVFINKKGHLEKERSTTLCLDVHIVFGSLAGNSLVPTHNPEKDKS